MNFGRCLSRQIGLFAGCVLVCPTCGFGQANAARAAEGPPNGLVERDAVPDGNEKRLDVCSRPQDRPHNRTVVIQVPAAAASQARHAVRPAQAALGHTDGGNSQVQGDVAGQAKPARMRDALAVAHNQVRPSWEAADGLDDGRGFAKRKQTGNVGKAAWTDNVRGG